MDAGMPSVAELTERLAHCLPQLCDINGNERPEFQQLFDAIANYDPEVKKNYERFFEWLDLLIKTQKAPFKGAFAVKGPSNWTDVAFHLRYVINRPICEILSARRNSSRYDPSYLSMLKVFIPNGGRLKVFSLNYDVTVEDACQTAGTSFTTGFRNTWHPSLFRNPGYAINLYKLHGSLSWCSKTELEPAQLIEKSPDDCDPLPELVLGPGTKLQNDDPFVTLYSEFHNAITRAKACVIMGWSFRDDHIKKPLRAASNRGMKVVDVRPGDDRETCFTHYQRISMSAKEALESGAILAALR